MSDSIKASGPRTPKRRFRLLLAVSLALNLLVVGAVMGALLNGPGKRGGPVGMREVSAPYVAAFDKRDKRQMRRELQANLPDRRDALRAHDADYKTFLELVRADSFDAARATEIMDTQFQRVRQFQRVGRELAIKRLGDMSKAERDAYADRLEERLANRKKHGKRKER